MSERPDNDEQGLEDTRQGLHAVVLAGFVQSLTEEYGTRKPSPNYSEMQFIDLGRLKLCSGRDPDHGIIVSVFYEGLLKLGVVQGPTGPRVTDFDPGEWEADLRRIILLTKTVEDKHKSAPSPGRKMPIIYRDPTNPEYTWTGQGRAPKWMPSDKKDWDAYLIVTPPGPPQN